MKVLRPTIFPSVPRLFNRIYEAVTSRLEHKSVFERWLFNRAVKSK
jgi:long-subunit acyl-CoA synthetase (AMP-forming)